MYVSHGALNNSVLEVRRPRELALIKGNQFPFEGLPGPSVAPSNKETEN